MPVRSKRVVHGAEARAQAWALKNKAEQPTLQVETISRAEHELLAEKLSDKYEIVSRIMFDSGCKIDEILQAIQPEDIDFERGVIWVKDNSLPDEEYRPAPMSDGTMLLLRNYIKRNGIEIGSQIFSTTRTAFNKALKTAVKETALEPARKINVRTYHDSKVMRLVEAKVPDWLIHSIVGGKPNRDSIYHSSPTLDELVEAGHKDIKW